MISYDKKSSVRHPKRRFSERRFRAKTSRKRQASFFSDLGVVVEVQDGLVVFGRLQPLLAEFREQEEESEPPNDQASDHQTAFQVQRDDVQSGGLERDGPLGD